MSFYTSLEYYRPRAAPLVTGDDLARFLADLRETKTLTDTGLQILKVKFGKAIDQDDKGSMWEEDIGPLTAVTREIEWDISLPNPRGLDQIIGKLRGDNRRVYRADAMLGALASDVRAPITRVNSPENEVNFYPHTLSVEMGPVYLYTLASEQPLHAGWISVGISGSGYLFPWSVREVVNRAQGSEAIGRIAAVCRRFWPVAPAAPEPRIVELRRQFHNDWPYDEFDKPWDWYWGVAESG